MTRRAITRHEVRRGLIARVHIAAKDLGLDDSTRNDVMMRAVGKRSCLDCTNAQLAKVVDTLKELGWQPSHDHLGSGKTFTKSKKAYVRKIWAIWGDMKRRGLLDKKDDPRGWLMNFVANQTGLKNIEWLTPSDANQVIAPLQAMVERGRIGRI